MEEDSRVIDNHTIQTLQEIVAKMGRDSVCEKPHAFAGAILDMCNANDVKLLTTVLRSHYSNRLMAYFQSGSGDAADWTQQKTFLIDESGMSVENVESVLDVLWKAMGWQRLTSVQSKPADEGKGSPKEEPKPLPEHALQKDYTSMDGSSAKVDSKYKEKHIEKAESPETVSEQKKSKYNGFLVFLGWVCVIGAIYSGTHGGHWIIFGIAGIVFWFLGDR